jgi:uncharacterized membrane protein YphA (DoxX/SURF4 family)
MHGAMGDTVMTTGAVLLVSLSALAARVLLGAIFLQAGVQKLRHYAEWQGVVGNYRMMPPRLAPAFAGTVLVVELVLAVVLWFGRVPVASGAAGGAAALLVLFSIAIGVNLARGRSNIDCGCFQSAMRQTLSTTLLVRNSVLILIALAVSETTGLPVTAPLLAMATCLGAVCFVLYLALNELLVQSRPTLTLPALRRI